MRVRGGDGSRWRGGEVKVYNAKKSRTPRRVGGTRRLPSGSSLSKRDLLISRTSLGLTSTRWEHGLKLRRAAEYRAKATKPGEGWGSKGKWALTYRGAYFDKTKNRRRGWGRFFPLRGKGEFEDETRFQGGTSWVFRQRNLNKTYISEIL